MRGAIAEIKSWDDVPNEKRLLVLHHLHLLEKDLESTTKLVAMKDQLTEKLIAEKDQHAAEKDKRIAEKEERFKEIYAKYLEAAGKLNVRGIIGKF